MKRWFLAAAILISCGAFAHADPGGDRLVNKGREGQTFDFKPDLVPGKTNIIDFFSPYCSPCLAVMPRLEKLARKNPKVVVLRLDMNRPAIQDIDWQSPLSLQYHLDKSGVPQFLVYGPDGKLVARDDAAQDRVYRMLKQAGL